jgi:hypothetical protein
MTQAHKVAFELDALNRQQARCDQCGVIFTARGLARRAAAGTILLLIGVLALAALVLGQLLWGLSPVVLTILICLTAAGLGLGLICRDPNTVLEHGQPRIPMGRC